MKKRVELEIFGTIYKQNFLRAYEQKMCISCILEQKDILDYCLHANMFQNSEPTEEDLKWYNELSEEQAVKFGRFTQMNEKDLVAKKSEAKYNLSHFFKMLIESELGIICSILNKKYPNIMKTYETKCELFQNVEIEIFKALPSYAYDILFNTFVTRLVLHAGEEYLAEKFNTTLRLSYNEKKVTPIIDELTKNGRAVNPALAAAIADIPYQTTTNIMLNKTARDTTLSIDGMIKSTETLSEDNIDESESAFTGASTYDSPEEAYEKGELKNLIQNKMTKLRPFEMDIVYGMSGYNGTKLTAKHFAQKYNRTEEEINRYYATGKRTLKRMLEKEPLIKDSFVRQKATSTYNHILSFSPKGVSDTDKEDAISLMEDNDFKI